MPSKSSPRLKDKSCQPCHAQTPAITGNEALHLLRELENWQLSDEGKSLFRTYEVKDFLAGVDFLRRVAEIAEREDHHPDFHLTEYRNVRIELTTHAIDGLSENDFILAAKIDAAPVALKKKGS
jgi:4a-hydroxytetrahydrobiopterin dehydratase